MYQKIKNISFLMFSLIFLFLILKHYFSEENIVYTNKSRSTYLGKINQPNDSLPLLKNDTNNIIIYTDDIKKFNEKRKKRFWENLLLKKNE